jgi:DNA polymerase III subunit epsilon
MTELPLWVRTEVPDSALVARARTFLAAGPAPATALIAYVCQLPGPPRMVAEHMAVALFERSKDFARDAEGRWSLAGGRGIPDRQAQQGAHEWRGIPVPARPLALGSLSYVVVDVETTGTRPFGGDRITEVAAVTVRSGEIVSVYESLVNPERSIPRFITALTRISWSMVKHAPPFRNIAAEVSGILDGHLFVAHNAAFDWRFMAAELQRASGARLLGERLCTVRLARALLPQLRRRSLDSLARYYGVDNTARHRAGGDAVATAQILLRLLNEAESRGCATLEDLRMLTSARPRRRRRRWALPGFADGDFPA